MLRKLIIMMLVLAFIAGCQETIIEDSDILDDHEVVEETTPIDTIVNDTIAIPAERPKTTPEITNKTKDVSNRYLGWKSETSRLGLTIRYINVEEDGSGIMINTISVNVENKGSEELTPRFKVSISDDIEEDLIKKYFDNIAHYPIKEGKNATFVLYVHNKIPRSQMEKKITINAYDEASVVSEGISVMRMVDFHELAV